MATAASVREANRIFNKAPCHGDPQLAYKVLGLNSTATVPARVIPNWTAIVLHVNEIFGRINPPSVAGLGWHERQTLRFKAAIGVRKVVDAIFAIGPFDNENWWKLDSWENGGVFVLNNWFLDRPIDGPGLVQPIPFAAWAAYVPIVLPEPRLTGPTWRDLQASNQRRQARVLAWLPWDVRAEVVNPTLQTIDVHGCTGDGSCYWYATSYSYYGTRDNWAIMKADIRRYFTAVLNNPSHDRYRTYVQIEVMSRFRSGTYGETSLLRSLHNNDRDIMSWRPRNYLGVNQVVADYYHAEVLEFDDPRNYQPQVPRNNVFPDPPRNLVPRARGLPNAPNQIIIFNTEQHFDAGFPRAVVPPQARFPAPVTNNDRVEWMPWYVHNPVPIPDADMPIALPASSGVANPAARASQTEIRYVQACRNYPGFFPVLPPQDVIDSWEDQLEPRPHIPPPAQTAFVAADGPPPVPVVAGSWLARKQARDTGPGRPLRPAPKRKLSHGDKAYKR